MVKILILDDDQNAAEYLVAVVQKYISEPKTIANCTDVETAKNYISLHQPNLVFLDVEMKEINGFEFLHGLPERNFEVIFTTAYSKYAIQAIRFSAVDFLLKPVQPDELMNAFQRFLSEPKETARRFRQFSLLFENLKSDNEKEFKLTLKKGNQLHFISPHDIYWCKGEKNYTKLFLKDNSEFIAAKTLKEFEEMLTDFGFIRVHKSSLINFQQARHIEQNFILLTNNVSVEISRRRKEMVVNLMSRKKQ
jgi:two-component system, LytTR family, response regulator